MSEPSHKLQIPPEVLKFIDKNASREAKMMAAAGLVPMAPNIMVTALFTLTMDGDEQIQSTATKTLLAQPEAVVMSLLSQPLHPKILDFYAQHRLDNAKMLEVILLNKLTADETFVFLAPQVNDVLLNIIAENQERMLRTPAIAEALRKNPQLPQSTADRFISFLRLHGIILEGVSAELTDSEVKTLLAEDDQQLLNSIYEAVGDDSLDDLSAILFDEKDDDDLTKEGDADNIPVIRRLSTLTVSEKIKLALRGNKEVRNALIKDPNKLVCTSVIKSPKMQESEVIAIAAMRSVNDEVLRIIARNPDWVKNYTLKNTLASNPKCPLPISLMFVKHLRANELAILAKNKNVSQQVQRLAKQLYEQKR